MDALPVIFSHNFTNDGVLIIHFNSRKLRNFLISDPYLIEDRIWESLCKEVPDHSMSMYFVDNNGKNIARVENSYVFETPGETIFEIDVKSFRPYLCKIVEELRKLKNN